MYVSLVVTDDHADDYDKYMYMVSYHHFIFNLFYIFILLIRLDILLKQKDANISSLTIEIVRHVENCLLKKQNSQSVSTSSYQNNLKQISSLPTITSSSSYISTSLSQSSTQSSSSSSVVVSINKQELHENILKTIKDCIGVDNPVLKLFTKRVYKLILRGILGQNYQHLLPSYSLQSIGHKSNIEELIKKCTILFNHNYSIFYELYNDIIARACTIGLNSNADDGGSNRSGNDRT